MLKQQEISELIPHTGSMCLLDSIEYWDENKIICRSRSHLKEDNPLRNKNSLPMTGLLEYAAQAMAAHACLVVKQEPMETSIGYLAALKNIELAEGDLSDVKEMLKIQAEKIYKEAGSIIYTIKVQAGSRLLATGRTTVMAKIKALG